jgi:DNA-binding GntR family transcriptional regulator
MPIRADDPRLPYLQIADSLRDDINAGRYQEGDQLPSTRRLAENHGVSTGTVQRAMKVLRKDGLIGAHQGRGAFVLPQTAHPEPDPTTPKTLDEALELLADMQQRLDRLEAQTQGAHQAPAVEDSPESNAGLEPDL